MELNQTRKIEYANVATLNALNNFYGILLMLLSIRNMLIALIRDSMLIVVPMRHKKGPHNRIRSIKDHDKVDRRAIERIAAGLATDFCLFCTAPSSES